MALGLARMFGIRLPINFCSPYKALSISDFWRRWHITLSRFLRDYLYIPLGGNRSGILGRHGNLLLTMLRETVRSSNQLAMGGTLQGATEQPLELLRIELKQEYGVYPVISAHRNRYTIHLINDETGKTDTRNLPLRLGLSLEQK